MEFISLRQSLVNQMDGWMELSGWLVQLYAGLAADGIETFNLVSI